MALVVGLAMFGSLLLQPWTVGAAGGSIFATVIQTGFFIVKLVFFAWLFIWVRWTVPSFRYDQVMRLGWKILLPVGLLNLVVTAVWLTVAHR